MKKSLFSENVRCGDGNRHAFFNFFLFFVLSNLFLLPPMAGTVHAGDSGQYPFISGVNKTFTVGQNVYDDSESYTSITRAYATYHTPLIADLNNDNSNELIVLNYNSGALTTSIDIYNTTSLSPVTSYTRTGASGDKFSNIVTADLDNDGSDNILYTVMGGGNEHAINCEMVNYALSCVMINYTNLVASLDYSIIACNNDNVCLSTWWDTEYFNYIIEAGAFNGSATGQKKTIATDTGDQDGICPPANGHIGVGDVDNDGREEFVISWLEVDDGSEIHIEILSVSPSGLNITHEKSINYDIDGVTAQYDDTQPDCLADGYGFKFSSPLVMDIDGFPSNGLEIVVGAVTDDPVSEFKMFAWKYDGTFIDDYPETFDATGKYVSNVIPMNIWDNTFNDFCVLGYNPDDGENSQLVCADAGNDVNEKYDFDTNENISVATHYHSPNIIHRAENVNGNQYAEIITPYGIYKLDRDNDELDRIYEFSEAPVTAITGRLGSEQYENLIYMTSTNLYYLSDGFVNRNCNDDGCITNIEIDPCYESTIKQNTTISIKVTGSDLDDNAITYIVSVYEGLAHEQNETLYNQTSGATVPFSFTLFNRSNNAILQVQAYDTENPTDIETKQFNLNVDYIGLVFGDGSCSQAYEVVDDEVVNVTQGAVNNVVDNSLSGIEEETGFSRLGLWYMAILFFVGGIVFYGLQQKWDARSTMASAVITCGVMLLVGGAFEVVPVTHIVGFVIVLAGGIAIAIRQQTVGG